MGDWEPKYEANSTFLSKSLKKFVEPIFVYLLFGACLFHERLPVHICPCYKEAVSTPLLVILKTLKKEFFF